MMTEPTDPIPDETLRAEILAAFAADRRTAHADLRVGVLYRLAHLAGTVDTPAERAAAEELAAQIPGVRGVVNRIEAPGAPSPARTVNLTARGERLDEV
jgi:osmotically-inducible protein OsmY